MDKVYTQALYSMSFLCTLIVKEYLHHRSHSRPGYLATKVKSN